MSPFFVPYVTYNNNRRNYLWTMAKFNDTINGSVPTLVDFHATWCGPCKTMSPILDSLKKEKGEQLRILKIDVDKNKMLASQLGIRSVPTLIYYKSGKLIWRKSGVLSLQELKSSLN
jgi:thioredoxin 1